ncbi:MAG: protoheme IX farnesyltransferase [Kiritimatiellia bacterium]|jgi:heme o synthase
MLTAESRQNYLRLSKPGITRMVMITAALGYVMGGHGVQSIGHLLLSVLAIGLASAGSSVLNNFLERDIDGLMGRTAARELPTGKVSPENALGFGILLVFMGTGLLILFVNLLTAFLVLMTAFTYVLIYTPLKRKTWLNTSIGAVPGAMPMACGWVASTGEFGLGAWLLFAIMFCWQHPHFYAIAWMYKDDYEKAGFKMLSVVDQAGYRLFLQVILYALLLLAISVIPVGLGMAGKVYLFGAIVLGLYFIYFSLAFIKTHTRKSARDLLKASIIYLPALFGFVLIDVLV